MQCFREDWGVLFPREFQVQAIYRGVYYNDSFSLIATKTGYGKSLVAMVIATLRQRVTIIEVSLIGLGADQVAKAIHVDVNIEAWHVDEFCGKKGFELKQRLDKMTEEERQKLTMILFMLPRTLKPDSEWMPVLERFARKGSISFMCVDEAHHVNFHGGCF